VGDKRIERSPGARLSSNHNFITSINAHPIVYEMRMGAETVHLRGEQ